MRYKKGDIVEIITAKYKSWNDIPPHEKAYYETQDIPAPFIGQRFRVWKTRDDKGLLFYRKRTGDIMSPFWNVHKDHVRLYKRPFINYLKF